MSILQPKRVLYLIVCAAPPAQRIDELIELLHQTGWNICVIPTPRAAIWLDCHALAQQTGYPVRHDYQQPGDPDTLPRADAIAVVPATFNTINKWAAGISDTFALGMLNETIGLKLPAIVAPYVKPTLAAHPQFAQSLKRLGSWGVRVMTNEAIRVQTERQKNALEDKSALSFHWRPVVDTVMGVFKL